MKRICLIVADIPLILQDSGDANNGNIFSTTDSGKKLKFDDQRKGNGQFSENFDNQIKLINERKSEEEKIHTLESC